MVTTARLPGTWLRDRLRRWWPVLAALVVSVVAQRALLTSGYDVSGHAAEHLSGAGVPFFACVVAVALFVSTRPALRQPLVLAAVAAWVVTTVFVLIGNVRVVDALVAEGFADTPTGQLVPTPAVEAAHGLANAAPWWGVLAAIAVSAALWRHGHLSWKAAVATGVVSLLFPPWIIPGAGVVVATVLRGVAFAREGRSRGPGPLAGSPGGAA